MTVKDDHSSQNDRLEDQLPASGIDENEEEEGWESLLSTSQKPKLKPYQNLVTNQNVFRWAIFALRYGVFCDSVNLTTLQPNHPFMASGSHPVSDRARGWW